ncbi:MAG: branched-chain amino acid ABC transporter permease [Actinomycetota bacterium]|nr:branched-chain amino acid ABC transporter permease [Actinomycetota bacterium]
MARTLRTPAREAGPAVEREQQRRDIDLRRAVRWGLISGVTAVYVPAVGMVASFAGRRIAGVVTLGYLLMVLVPLTYGYVAGKPPPQLEGYAPARRGPRNVLAGLVTGVATALVLTAFLAVVDALDLRRMFINLSPQMVDQLTFGRGVTGGAALLLAGSAVAGAAGGAVHVIPQRWRRPLLATLLWVVTFGLLRDLIGPLLRGTGLGAVADMLYARGGGLSGWGAAIVAVSFFAFYAVIETRRTTVRERFEAMPARQRRTYGAVALAVGVVVVGLLPQVLGPFLSEILDLVGIYLLMALGLNIVVGYAGLLDLGYVAFFAVGAYTAAVLTSPGSPRWSPELTIWLALPSVVLAAAMAGIIVGTPVLRMRGDYLAIVTLGFGEIARILFLSDWLKPVFGGAQGITRVPPVSVGPIVLRTPPQFFYAIAFFAIIAAYVSWALRESRIGRAWMAMREDESVAEVLGINIASAKLSAFIVGAVLASFGGALFASKIGSVFPNSFNIVVSIIVLVIIIVGGMGSLPGVAVGALVLVGAPQLLREFEAYQFLLYGALLIFMMVNRPEGLIPSKRRARELHQDELMQDAWISRQQEHEGREAPASPERSPDAGLT